MASYRPDEPHSHELVNNSQKTQNCFLCGLYDIEIATGIRLIEDSPPEKMEPVKMKGSVSLTLDAWVEEEAEE